MIDIAHIDLNLLVIFHEMYQLRNVSQVAKRLGLSQPTVSNALSRLRKTCDDDLFVRTGQGMQPTPYGQQISEPIAHALLSLTQALNQEDRFNPETSKRHFVIAMTDVGEIHFMPALVDLCRRTAPHIGISSVRASAVDWQQGMETGQIDLAIGAFANVAESLYHRKLFSQNYVVMFRKGHRFGDGGADLKEFIAATHLLVTSRDSPYDQINARLEKLGISGAVNFQVPHFTAVPYILSTTDMVVIVPKKLAEQTCVPFALDFIEPPLRLPMLHTNILWHRRYNQDKGNQWLRGLIAERFKE